MSRFSTFYHEIIQDKLLHRVMRNTGYLFSSNTISMGLSFAQGILAAALLGPAGYGTLGIIVAFASTVNRLLSFRMGELVIRYAGQYLAVGRKDQAAAVIKVAGLSEAAASVIAYLVLVLLAPLGARYIVKDAATSILIVYYGVALLGNLMTETATAVLQIGNHYRSQALLNLLQSALTAGWIGVAFLTRGNLLAVLNAYLAGKLLFGLGIMAVAFYWLRPTFGPDWARASFRLLPSFREMAGYAVSTNLSSTINMVFRDSEVLWVGLFLNNTQAGYFKFAQGLINVVSMPVSPLITTTFPEISRAVARREWKPLRSLLRRTSLVAAAWTLACAAGLLALGVPVLNWFKGGAYLPAYPAILILVAGYGVANIFFWNRPLLLAFGNPNAPLKVNFIVGLVKTALMFVLVPRYGYLAQAGLLAGYFIVSVLWIVARGLEHIRRAERAALVEEPA